MVSTEPAAAHFVNSGTSYLDPSDHSRRHFWFNCEVEQHISAKLGPRFLNEILLRGMVRPAVCQY
jgi:hypothetical protein